MSRFDGNGNMAIYGAKKDISPASSSIIKNRHPAISEMFVRQHTRTTEIAEWVLQAFVLPCVSACRWFMVRGQTAHIVQCSVVVGHAQMYNTSAHMYRQYSVCLCAHKRITHMHVSI